MNKTLSTFLSIAVTVVAIGAFLFGVAYNMTNSESGNYKTNITTVHTKLPIIP